MMRPVLGAAILIGALCSSSVATADARTHDGVYIQLQGGLGYYHSGTASGGTDVSFSGLTIPAALLVGHSLLKPGLTIGGGLLFDYAVSPSYKVDGASVSSSGNIKQTIIGLGAFGDYYLRPEGGAHFQAFLGWGDLATSFENTHVSDPTGLTVALGGGYDFFLSDELSFGVLGRLLYGAHSINGVGYSTIEPAVVATLTYN